VRVARGIGLVEVVKAIDAIRWAIGKLGLVLVGPAFLAQAGHGDGDADRAFEFFQREKNLRAMGPRAGVGDVEVIAPSLSRKTRRPVGGDLVAKHAVNPLEIAGLADLCRVILITPLAVHEDSHYAASPRASDAAWRIAAMFAP
jgi:hypothetical protein